MYTYHFILDGYCLYEAKTRLGPASLVGKEIKIPYLIERYKIEGFTLKGHRECNLFLVEVLIESPTH